jgi:hypothetical protein
VRGSTAALERLRRALRIASKAVSARDAAPLLLPLAMSPWLYVALRHYAQAPLFQDVGMYQYIAWCMRKGERIYQSIAVPDGPLIVLVHAVLQLYAGVSEVAFRRADLVFHAITAFATGALLMPRREGASRWTAAVVWGTFNAALWMVFVVHPGLAATVQREDYYVAMGTLSVVMAYRATLSTTVTPGPATGPWRSALLVASGTLAAMQLFGKQSGAVYVLLGAVVVVLAPGAPGGRARQARRYAAGVGLGTAAMLTFVAAYGSLGGLWLWYFRYVFTVYRFSNASSVGSLLSDVGMGHYASIAVLVLVAGATAVAMRVLPRQTLAFALAPAFHYGLALLQRKGFQYQFVPVVASLHVYFTLVLAAAWDDPRPSWSPARTAMAIGGMLLVGSMVFDTLRASPWLGTGPQLWDDPTIAPVRRAAAALRKNTKASDRVFFYGNDPILLFLAERLPATPYEVPWMVFSPPPPPPPDPPPPPPEHPRPFEPFEPTAAQRDAISTFLLPLQQEQCLSLERLHPRAIVFKNDHGDLEAQLVSYCPGVRDMLTDRYKALAEDLGPVRIYLHK